MLNTRGKILNYYMLIRDEKCALLGVVSLAVALTRRGLNNVIFQVCVCSSQVWSFVSRSCSKKT